MSNTHTKKSKKKTLSKLNQTNFELPLNNGFKRALIKRDDNRLISVYYVTPDDKYLKDISEVCDWIENNHQASNLSRVNFNFVAKQCTSHDNEYIVDYDTIPKEIKDYAIQTKKSVAPIIITVAADDTFSIKDESSAAEEPTIPIKRAKIEISSAESLPHENLIKNDKDLVENKPIENEPIENEPIENKPIENKPIENTPIENKPIENAPMGSDDMENEPMKCETMENEPMKNVELKNSAEVTNINCVADNNNSADTDENSLTLSVKSSTNEDVTDNVIMKPQYPFEYPLETIAMNSLVEMGTHFHIDRIRDILDGCIDQKLMKSMKLYCGNHCAFDRQGYPRVAFECDICLVLWHNDCIGHRWLTVANTSLMICDNCYLLQMSLNLDPPLTFCDVEKLLFSEIKPNIDGKTPLTLPVKFEPIIKLCKIQWVLQNKKMPTSYVNTKKKGAVKELICNSTMEYKHFIKIFINQDCVLHDLKEDFVRLKYSTKNIDRMASIFADVRCEMLLNGELNQVFVSRITIKDSELIMPVCNRISQNGNALFYTFERGQDRDAEYIARRDSLANTMRNSNQVVSSRQNSNQHVSQTQLFTPPNINSHKEPPTQSYSSKNVTKHKEPQIQVYNPQISILNEPLYQPPTNSIPSRILPRVTGPLSSKVTVIPSNRPSVISNYGIPTITSVSSQNLPKNAIPISKNQVKEISNLIKIRKRKQEFVPKVYNMASDTPIIQYHHLVDLPFFILEKIVTSKCLTTSDKLNCRLASRVLRCVIDAGHGWSKVVINPGLVTGLQALFDFFSPRNVKKMTFEIDFHESFGIEFFTSFISRLKLYPECFQLENISVKLSGLKSLSTRFSLPIQDILNCNKSLRRLAVCGDEPIVITLGKSGYLVSDSLQTLKLQNIANIADVLRTHGEYTPKLRKVRCGDWSRIISMDMCSLTHITRLRMDFSEYVLLNDVTTFAMLINLEHLVISRPRINESLKSLLQHLLAHKSLKYFRLETELVTKDQLSACTHFGSYFPGRIRRICWHLYLSALLTLADPGFSRKLVDFMPSNVEVVVFNI